MDRVVYVLVAILLAGGLYHFWDTANSLEKDNAAVEQKLHNELEKQKIRITKTNLSGVTKFTFLEITNQFDYLYEKKYGKWLKADNVDILFTWDYTFSFGFDLTDKPDWNWCPTPVAHAPGVIQINAPEIVQTNANPPAIKRLRTFNGAYWNEYKDQISGDVNKYADEKVAQVARTYLENPTTRESIKNALGAHLQRIMNDAYPDSNPISEVRVVFSDVCKAG